jgi:hypothetical protein
MSDWDPILGKLSTLRQATMGTELAKAFYQTVVRKKDMYVSELPDATEFDNYETLQQSLNPPGKNEKKNTYRGMKKIKDKETGLTIEQMDDLPMKKFITLTADLKNGLLFLLNVYMKQVYQYFTAKGKFDATDKMLDAISKFSLENCDNGLAASVIAISRSLNMTKIIKGHYNQINTKIVDKSKTFFKNADESDPGSELTIAVEAFCEFLKVMAVYTADILLSKRVAVNFVHLHGIMNLFNTHLALIGVPKFDDELISNMKEFIESKRPEKKTKDEKPDGTKKRGRPSAKNGKDGKDDTETEEEEEEESLNADDTEDKPWDEGIDETA